MAERTLKVHYSKAWYDHCHHGSHGVSHSIDGVASGRKNKAKVSRKRQAVGFEQTPLIATDGLANAQLGKKQTSRWRRDYFDDVGTIIFTQRGIFWADLSGPLTAWTRADWLNASDWTVQGTVWIFYTALLLIDSLFRASSKQCQLERINIWNIFSGYFLSSDTCSRFCGGRWRAIHGTSAKAV